MNLKVALCVLVFVSLSLFVYMSLCFIVCECVLITDVAYVFLRVVFGQGLDQGSQSSFYL